MKKFLLMLCVLSVFTAAMFADTKEKKEGWSDLSYNVVPVLKILESRDGYVVIYQKNKTGIGNVVIPKEWAHFKPDTARKLKFRNTKNNKESFMTVVKKGGEFSKVILSVPLSKQNAIWGLADYHKQLEGTDKETLEDLEF